MEPSFPPPHTVGNRVWTERGYFDHGPVEGPKVSITARTGGVIIGTEKPYYAMDQLLYTVRWDNGQISKHYYNELFCIGRFETCGEFKAAIKFEGEIQLTVGPRGGFRHVLMRVEYDGKSQDGRLTKENHNLWTLFFEPLAKTSKSQD